MTTATWIILAVISLMFSALFSGSEIAYITANRVRVELDAKRGGLIGHIINRFYSNTDLFISTILVGNNIMLVIYGMGASWLIEDLWLAPYRLNEALVLLISTLVSTGVILLVGEFLPKAIFRINPTVSLKIFAMPLFIFWIILWPVSVFTSWLSRSLLHLCGIKASASRMGMLSVTDLNSYLDTAVDDVNPELHVENEVKMFHNALDFSTTHLRDCMLPRNEIVAVNRNSCTREELSALFTSSGRSKIVVYDDDIDNVLGYIHVSELFDPDIEWTEHIKPVIFVPETLLANKLMRRLLSEKRSMAIVVDEFGGTAGLVTLEDLVEEIFGDIRDEHDTVADAIREVQPGIYECSGRVEIEQLRESAHIDIPEGDDYQTLAGYILFNTGAIPAEGETLVIDRYSFTIKRRTATRLELIRIETAPEQSQS